MYIRDKYDGALLVKLLQLTVAKLFKWVFPGPWAKLELFCGIYCRGALKYSSRLPLHCSLLSLQVSVFLPQPTRRRLRHIFRRMAGIWKVVPRLPLNNAALTASG